MKRRTSMSTLITCVLVLALALISAPVASSAPKDKGIEKVTFFGENRSISYVDLNGQPGDFGDKYFREIALSKTINGPVMGVIYSQAEVVAFDPVTKADVRRVNLQIMLPGGDLFLEGLSEVELAKPVKAGWHDTYAVVGGTGKYFGAGGTGKITLLPGDKVFRYLIKLVRPAGFSN
jgi:hypothetical protein